MISLAELKTYLKITDVSQDDQLNQAIDLAKGFVASYVWYSLVLNTTTVAEFCWETNQFYLKRKGINSVSLIEYYEDEFNPAYISYNVTTDRRENLELGYIKTRDYIWPFVKITYSFGYTDWTCPQDLKTANLEIASSYYKRQWAISMNDMNSESVDGDTISFKAISWSISESSLSILDNYIYYDFSA